MEASPIEACTVCVIFPESDKIAVLIGSPALVTARALIEEVAPLISPKIFKVFASLIIILPEPAIAKLVNEVLVLLIVRIFASAIEIVPEFIVSPLRFRPTLPIFTFPELLILRLSLMSALIKFKFPEPLISELFPLLISLVTLTSLVNSAPIS